MEKIIEKISSYNLYNYLLTGVLFSIISKKFLLIKIDQENIFTFALLCYFIGLTISRFGSLVLKPFLEWISFIRFSKYKDFVAASKKDLKINILSRENNVYRTLCSLFIVLLLLKIYILIETIVPFLRNNRFYILTISLSISYLLAYRKQTEFIYERVEINNKKNKK